MSYYPILFREPNARIIYTQYRFQSGQGYLWADPSGGGGAWEAVALLPVQHYGARCACFDNDGNGRDRPIGIFFVSADKDICRFR